MSNIYEALKKAQAERDRLRAASEKGGEEATKRRSDEATKNEGAAGLASETPVATPATATVTPVTAAMKQGVVSSADRRASQVADTIVEDYESKRKLHLPSSVVVYHDRAGAIAEQYRRVRNALVDEGKGAGPRMFVITSSVPGEGKTITTLNLGLSMAELRAVRVLLIDGDLHHTTLSTHMKMQVDKGLSDVLSAGGEIEAAEIDGCVRATPWQNLFVLPAGRMMPPKLATVLLRTPRTRTILRHLRNRFDVTLIDTPSAGKCPDAGVLGAWSDGVLLTVSLHHTTQSCVERTIRMLESGGIAVKGTVLTRN